MAQYSGETSFLFGANETYIAEMYGKFLQDPGLVDGSWVDFFSQLNDDSKSVLDELKGASWALRETSVVGGNGNQPNMSDSVDPLQVPPSAYLQTRMQTVSTCRG